MTGPVPAGCLEFHGVTKAFRDPVDEQQTIVALDRIGFAIAPGGSVGIIGANGAGKSTILKLAAGVTAPTEGRIERTGRTVAVIELGAGMHPDLTGAENLDLLAALTMGRGGLSARRREQIVDFAGLAAVLDRPARFYSTGMIARLAFSVAVHADADLLLVDEVLSVGDLEFQQRCRDRLFQLTGAGTTVVVVSHDLGLITGTCDRCLLVDDGRLVLDGPTDAVVRHYRGLPSRDPDRDDLAASLVASRVVAPVPLIVDMEVPDDLRAARLRCEVVIRTQGNIAETEQDLTVVVGNTHLPVPAQGHHQIRLASDGLPSGRYELHITLEGGDGTIVRGQVLPFTVAGAPGPFAIRLGGDWVVDGSAVAP